MGNGETTMHTVTGALQEVAEWREAARARHQDEIKEVDLEVENLRKAVANLQQQLDALGRFRDELVGKGARIDEEEVRRTYDRVFQALSSQREALAARAAAVVEAEKARQEAIAALMAGPAIAPLVKEIEQFKTHVEPTLALLPESYRAVILEHHDGVTRRVQELVDEAHVAPIAVEGPTVEVDVVYAIDAPEGLADLLMLVLPVEDAVQTRWTERQEDLQARLAARIVEGLYKACHQLGMTGVQAMFGGHQGLLAVEVELTRPDPDALDVALKAAFHAAQAGAADLEAARVAIRPVRLSVDHLLPPEEEGADAGGGGA
jgi:hypothetical protein